MIISPISLNVYNLNQSWIFDRIVNVNGQKLRVLIVRNAYDTQSSAQVQLWSGSKWEQVYTQPISACNCQRISYVQKDITEEDFDLDYTNLLCTALKII